MTGTFTVLTKSQLDDAAVFIASLNSKKEHHIGFCGTEKVDILKTLHEDFLRESSTTLCAYFDNQSIQALIGLDIDEDTAEVWGPFMLEEDMKLQYQLWLFLKDQFPSITQFQFFINAQNVTQNKFMDEIGAKKSGEHLNLEIHRNTFTPTKSFLSQFYVDQDFASFSQLHDDVFPNTYYDAEQIIQKIAHSKENKLKILKMNNHLQGYAYYQLDLEEQTAHLEYISIAPEYRGLGLGTTLLKEVLTDIFSYEEVQQISLTVNNKNNHANYVYYKAGFVKKDLLLSYVLKISE